MKRLIVSFLMITIMFILQGTLFKALAFGGIAPNMMLMITSCYGFMRGQNEGMAVGFFSGLLTDVFFGGGMLGLYAFIYLLMGFSNGYFHRIFYPEDVKLPIIFIAASDITCCMVVYVLTFLLRRRMDFPAYLGHVMLPETVYTVLATLIFYRLVLAVNTKLEAQERSEESIFV